RTGSGAETDVAYSGSGTPFSSQDCVRGWDPQPQANPNRCFPAYFTNGSGQSGWDWFHKYLVTSVVDKDLTGGSPDEVTSYSYSAVASTAASAAGAAASGSSDAALWRHDTSEALNLAHRSWTLWQGYATVTTTHGPAGGPQTVSTTVYHRG